MSRRDLKSGSQVARAESEWLHMYRVAMYSYINTTEQMLTDVANSARIIIQRRQQQGAEK